MASGFSTNELLKAMAFASPVLPAQVPDQPGRFSDADPTAKHLQAVADAHTKAASMWQSASDAYHSGDSNTATAMYGLASEASARAHDLADQKAIF